MLRLGACICCLGILWSGSIDAQDAKSSLTDSPEAYFQKAWHYESVEAKWEEALAMYEGIAANAEIAEATRAKAQYRSAICLRKLGRRKEARVAFEKVVEEYVDVKEVASAAKREIEGESKEEALMRRRVADGLRELRQAKQSSNRDNASSDTVNKIYDLGPRAVPALVDSIQSSDDPGLQDVVSVILSHGREDESAEAAARRIFKDKKSPLRLAMIQTVGEFSTDIWNGDLLALLDDPDAKVRAAAATSVGKKKNLDRETKLETLTARLSDPDAGVRAAVVSSLGEIAALDAVRSMYRDGDSKVRLAALRATAKILGSRGDRAAMVPDAELNLLEAASPDETKLIIDITYLVYQQRPGKTPWSVMTPETVEGIVRKMDDAGLHISIHSMVVEMLAATRSDKIFPLVHKGLRNSDARAATAALDAAITLADDRFVPDLIDFLDREKSRSLYRGWSARRPYRPGIRLGPRGKDSSSRAFYSKIWTALQQEFWSVETLEQLAARLPKLEFYGSEVVSLVYKSKRRDLANAALLAFGDVLDVETRRAILQWIVPGFKDLPSALDAVLEGLEDPSHSVRSLAVDRSRAFPAARVIAPIIACYRDERIENSSLLRIEAATALSNYRDPRVLPVMLDALRSPAQDLAVSVIENKRMKARIPGHVFLRPWMEEVVRGRWPDIDVVQALIGIIADPRTLHPDASLMVLTQVSNPEDASKIAASLPRVRAEIRIEFIETLGALGNTEIRGDIERALETETDVAVRMACLQALIAWRDAQSLPAILRAAREGEGDLQKAAVTGLAEYPPEVLAKYPELLVALEGCYGEGSYELRLEVVRVLAVLKSEASVALIGRALNDEGDDIRAEAARALGDIGGERAFGLLLSRFSDEPLEVIALSLAKIGDPRALPAITDRLVLDRGFGKLSLSTYRAYPEKDAIDQLERIVSSQAPLNFRTSALRRIGGYRSDLAKRVVLRYFEDDTWMLREAAVQSAGAFVDSSFLPHLVERLRDPDSRVVAAARQSIEMIRYYEEQKRLLEGVKKKDANDEILAMLESDVPAVRLAAVKALVRLGNSASLPALVRLRKDEDAGVRAAVDRALDELTEK